MPFITARIEKYVNEQYGVYMNVTIINASIRLRKRKRKSRRCDFIFKHPQEQKRKKRRKYGIEMSQVIPLKWTRF